MSKPVQQAMFQAEAVTKPSYGGEDIKKTKQRFYVHGFKRVWAREILKLGPKLQWILTGTIAVERQAEWAEIDKNWFEVGPASKICYELVDRYVIKFRGRSAWYEAMKDSEQQSIKRAA